jgi:hypothetical protein
MSPKASTLPLYWLSFGKSAEKESCTRDPLTAHIASVTHHIRIFQRKWKVVPNLHFPGQLTL